MPAGFEKLFKLDDWNDVVIIAQGNHIQHYLNGRLILDFTDNDPATGAQGRHPRPATPRRQADVGRVQEPPPQGSVGGIVAIPRQRT